MRTVPLYALAHARPGDKGDASNVGVIAYDVRGYEILLERLTPQAVKDHFGDLVLGDVERYEMPNLLALNFELHGTLGGGGSASLKNDAQGKTHGRAMLRQRVPVPDDYALPAGAMAPDGELGYGGGAPCAG